MHLLHVVIGIVDQATAGVGLESPVLAVEYEPVVQRLVALLRLV
jgi:hypothetical protein